MGAGPAAGVDARPPAGDELVRWFTEIDNRTAQAVYERTGARRPAWFEHGPTVADGG